MGRRTPWNYKQKHEDCVYDPVIGSSEIHSDHGNKHRQGPKLGDHGCQCKLVPYLCEVGETQQGDN